MALVFREIHPAPDRKRINEEWYVLENSGAAAISTGGLQVFVSKKGRRGSFMGMIDPGFVLQGGEKILVVAGVPGKKSQGQPPTREGMRVYHLFLREGLVQGDGTVIRLALGQMEVARVTFGKDAPDGIFAEA